MFLVVSKIILIARFCILSTCSDKVHQHVTCDNMLKEITSIEQLS